MIRLCAILAGSPPGLAHRPPENWTLSGRIDSKRTRPSRARWNVDTERLLKGKKVLVVDDEPDVLDTLEDLLPMCEVQRASSFSQAADQKSEIVGGGTPGITVTPGDSCLTDIGAIVVKRCSSNYGNSTDNTTADYYFYSGSDQLFSNFLGNCTATKEVGPFCSSY